MKDRILGKNGFKVSEVGLGCWQIGGNWGSVSEAEALDILRKAVANGIRFFDTADVYGDGRSERLIGKFLKENSTSIKVATKFGRGGDVYPDNYSFEKLKTSVESSLHRLGLEQIDLLQLHCIPTQVMRDGEIFESLRQLQKEGKIAHFGASVESEEEGLICLKQDGLQSLQVIFNIFRQKLADRLLPEAHEKGVGIIVRLPLASGLLTGKFEKNTSFSEDDHRHFNRDGEHFNVGETFAGLPFKKGVELANELKDICPNNLSMSDFALRWILDHDEVSTIIPGASSSRHIVDNSKVSEFEPLSAEVHSRLKAFYEEEVKDHIRGPY